MQKRPKFDAYCIEYDKVTKHERLRIILQTFLCIWPPHHLVLIRGLRKGDFHTRVETGGCACQGGGRQFRDTHHSPHNIHKKETA